jgi:hypothetical protein
MPTKSTGDTKEIEKSNVATSYYLSGTETRAYSTSRLVTCYEKQRMFESKNINSIKSLWKSLFRNFNFKKLSQ